MSGLERKETDFFTMLWGGIRNRYKTHFRVFFLDISVVFVISKCLERVSFWKYSIENTAMVFLDDWNLRKLTFLRFYGEESWTDIRPFLEFFLDISLAFYIHLSNRVLCFAYSIEKRGMVFLGGLECKEIDCFTILRGRIRNRYQTIFSDFSWSFSSFLYPSVLKGSYFLDIPYKSGMVYFGGIGK